MSEISAYPMPVIGSKKRSGLRYLEHRALSTRTMRENAFCPHHSWIRNARCNPLAMISLTIERLTKRFGETVALHASRSAH